ncbi:MAG TPA: TetR family transcriptional regulator [Saprospiraceae bacterium]|nr:TetR/AcrR family transcriptional regulator [Bacteroidota bacterium]MCB0690770.1 TetR/AcrR family transcriptional regulator [Saprospiraceae bacterium]MCB9328350.1 TetR/AcrR family transcriptional regulator [Lewinellaceae bacterium]HPK09259.1 TetR family transcriptional regulator [Saprospiraceae bacterium]HRX29958.1 TetR family transcriptional regulator [Saprospiraceae bacterium]
MLKAKEKDQNTEQRIKAAAQRLFQRKGFAATKTRDIADEAQINLALLNYYFGSKEKLFKIIMMESIFKFLQGIIFVFNDEQSSLEEKVQQIANRYIDFLSKEPEVPLFVLSELRNESSDFIHQLPIDNLFLDSVFAKQYKEKMAETGSNKSSLMHFLINLLSMLVFPFMSKPIISKIGNLNNKEFDNLMEERKNLVPIWIESILKTHDIS